MREHSPATMTYRIRIQGSLGEDWSGTVGGLSIVTEWQQGDRAVTTLRGELPDQSSLIDVINRLYSLGLPLISIERLAGAASRTPIR